MKLKFGKNKVLHVGVNLYTLYLVICLVLFLLGLYNIGYAVKLAIWWPEPLFVGDAKVFPLTGIIHIVVRAVVQVGCGVLLWQYTMKKLNTLNQK